MFLHHSVLCGWDVLAYDLLEAILASILYESVERVVLHTSLQYATAHEPSVNEKGFRILLLHNDDSYQAVVTKLIFESEAEGGLFVALLDSGNLILGIANSAEVELITSLRELSHT